MTFQHKFQRFVCEGDSITCSVDGFDLKATIYRDDNQDKPEDRDEGFWPSRDKSSAGYVGEDRYDDEMAKAKSVMAAWLNDEWFYCGVAVTVERNGVQLTGQYSNALWGVECNYPDSDNDYLRCVANELLSEALDEAKATRAKICA